MPEAPICILLVEDSPSDAELIRVMLEEEGSGGFDLRHTTRLSSGLEALARGAIDVVLLDLSLPDSFGMETVRKVREAAPDVPIVVMTGLKDETVGDQAIEMGAQDYLVKGQVDHHLLLRAIRYAIQRQRSEESLRKSEEQYRELAERLRQVNSELEAFTYSVSHDLRAPLRAMQGFAHALLEDCLEALGTDGQEYARRIAAAARRMETLISDLLAYSRLSRAELEMGPVDLDAVAMDVLEQLDAGLREKSARVEVERPLPVVHGHAATLFQVISNLVTNAVKFVAPDVTPHVRIHADPAIDGLVCLWVDDNGIGIDPQHHERIFMPFERLHGSDTYAGTGIGLAIVRKAMERMGGRAGVESRAGVGSMFWVKLRK
jgi:signal transduction histidine kinase